MLPDTATKRFAAASALSLLLHIVLIVRLPVLSWSTPLTMIHLQLSEPRPVLAQKMVPPKAPPKPRKPQPPLASHHSAPQAASEIADQPATAIHNPEMDSAVALQSIIPGASPEQSISQGNAAILDLPPTMYRYIASTFNVYNLAKGQRSTSPIGEATILYKLTEDAEHYQISSVVQAKGLAALFVQDLQQTSEGTVTRDGLHPVQYLYRYGNQAKRTYRASFDWQNQKLTLNNARGEQTLPLSEQTHDYLSLLYQFMFAPPLNSVVLQVTNGNQISTNLYIPVGEEIVDGAGKTLVTTHLVRSNLDGEEYLELWLAHDYAYIPVKILKKERKGNAYELLIRKLEVEEFKPVEQTSHPEDS